MNDGDEKKPPITVRELIAVLETMPPGAFVFTEGCDCEGPCSGAQIGCSLSDRGVLLARDDTRRWE